MSRDIAMDLTNYRSCQSHCCAAHGCKYGLDGCPVVNGRVLQDYLCPYCDGGEFNDEAPNKTEWGVKFHTGQVLAFGSGYASLQAAFEFLVDKRFKIVHREVRITDWE